ncbi:MAG: protein-L-isoaspartate(D-aspartate) O-methyltransferase [Candidatus Omnitrophica bacterium]|nr:protein-L-isoaspartate(D-aspartate) O-methyltransferase [Candidatus Omnitrophota bacterium]
MEKNSYEEARKRMVAGQLVPRGIEDTKILDAFLNIPRHLFVPDRQKKYAYEDYPLPIGWKQTISQPFIVALMTQFLHPDKGEKALEIGTGSGYQAAILVYLGCDVYSIERIPQLAEEAKEMLNSLGLEVKIKVDDGTLGWLEAGPFDKIIVTAAAEDIPQPLIEQLKNGGRLIMPVGGFFDQELTLVDKFSNDKIVRSGVGKCVFVPLLGAYGYKE